MQVEVTPMQERTNVIGEITCARYCISRDMAHLDVTVPFSTTFYKTEDGKHPSITPHKSAFIIRVTEDGMPNSRVINSFVALVRNVDQFAINMKEDLVKLTFSFTKLERNRGALYDLHPAVCHVFAEGEFIAMSLEGPKDACVEFADEDLAVFCCHDKFYHHVENVTISSKSQQDIDAGKQDGTFIALMYTGSTKEVYNKTEYDKFRQRAANIIGRYYIVQLAPSTSEVEE